MNTRLAIRHLEIHNTSSDGEKNMTGHTDEAIFARNSRGEGHSTIKSLAETKDLLEARSVTMGICPKKSAATPRSVME